ncbi:MAG: mono/diheme cytochrome c family protein [Flavobacteriales bacterium]|jgi:mono/diheme cytochrome c family protein
MKNIFLFTLTLLACACGENQPPNRLSADGSATQADAQKLYQMKCAICHGTDGKLMIGGAPDLSVSKKSMDERVALITNGKGTMPPQKDILTPGEIKALAVYVENFLN